MIPDLIEVERDANNVVTGIEIRGQKLECYLSLHNNLIIMVDGDLAVMNVHDSRSFVKTLSEMVTAQEAAHAASQPSI